MPVIKMTNTFIMIKFRLLIYLLLLSFYSFAQTPEVINGIVKNENSKEPIPFATIKIQGQNYGVISNFNGSFSLPIKEELRNGSILIGCLGYEEKLVPLNDNLFNHTHAFYLQEKVFELDDITIKAQKKRKLTAEEIVFNAITNIQSNYPSHPFLLEGYYRDYLKIGEGYLNLYESKVQIEDAGYEFFDHRSSKFRLLKARINRSFLYDSTMVINYEKNGLKEIPNGEIGYSGGNELAILRLHNPIRNYGMKNFDYINNLYTDFIYKHQFILESVVYEEGVPYYRISLFYDDPSTHLDHTVSVKFSTENPEDRLLKEKEFQMDVVGEMYVNCNDYVIKRLIYKVFTRSEEYGSIKAWELNMEYQDIQDMPYLKYLSFNNVVELPELHDSTYFHLSRIVADKSNRKLKFEFNNEINQNIVLNYKDIKIKYDNKKVKVKRIKVGPKEIIASIQLRKKLAGTAIDLSLIELTSNRLTDSRGNKLNEIKHTLGYQFREFFTENIETEFIPLLPKDCIDKRTSLFSYPISERKVQDIHFNSPLLGN